MKPLLIILLSVLLVLPELGATSVMVVTNRYYNPTTRTYGSQMTDSLQYLIAENNISAFRTTPICNFTTLTGYANKQLPMMVFVHGDGKTFDDVLKRSFELSEFYKVNVLLFTYPTKEEGLARLKNLAQSMVNARASAVHLSCLMDTLAQAIGNGAITMPVSWFFHSLGNYLLSEMMLKYPPACHQHKVFANIVLNAAAVDQRGHAQWLTRLRCAQSVVVNMNRRDLTLLGAQMFSPFHLALGRKVRNGNPDSLIYMKFNKVLGITGRRDAHSYYYGIAVHHNPHLRGYYEALLAGKPVNQLGYVKHKTDGTWYISPLYPPKRRGKQY